ncbi:probable G-protein coupled receptor 139 [Mobula birostris]|uniref:probable G-protein coupled receptor 139 n=1 Tax=Mobula birostris TaxID=1983395 RepID=UPI003B286BC4
MTGSISRPLENLMSTGTLLITCYWGPSLSSNRRTVTEPVRRTVTQPVRRTVTEPDSDGARTQDSDAARTQDSDGARTQDSDAACTQDSDAAGTLDSDAARTQYSDGARTQDSDGARTQDSDGARTQDSDGARTQDSDGARTQDSDAARTQNSDGARTQDSDGALNLVAIVILSLGNCGLSKCISRYLVGMAAADLMGVIIAVVLSEINNIYNYAFPLLITPICAVTLVLRVTAMDCSVWLTVAFTFDRCIAICSQKLRERYCTERTATIAIVIVCLWSCAKDVPLYFAVEPIIIIDNIPWRCILTMDFLTLPAWKAHQLFNTITTPLLPICLILLFNALTVSHIIAANRVRRGLRNSREKRNDPEVENRRKSIILLFALSANFILLWIPFIVYTMNWQVQNYSYKDKYLNTPSYILQQFGFMLQFLSTCTNTCIYTLSQRKFREEVKGGLKRLVTLNGRFCR